MDKKFLAARIYVAAFFVAVMSVAAGLVSAPANAAPTIVLNAGEGYFPSQNGVIPQGTCSLTAFGSYQGKRVALTAGHCGAPGVFATTWSWQTFGKFIYTASSPDHGFIELYPNVKTVQPFTKIGSPHVGEPVSKLGNGLWTAGLGSGVIYAVGGDDVCTTVPTSFGDSGGPLFSGTNLIGIGSRLANAPCGVFEFSRADEIAGFTLG